MTRTIGTMIERGLDWIAGAGTLLGTGVLGWTLKGAVILAAAAAASLLLRHHSAALRHVVWALAMAALLALPVLEATLPRWAVAPSFAPTLGPSPAPPASPEVVAPGPPGAAAPALAPSAPAAARGGVDGGPPGPVMPARSPVPPAVSSAASAESPVSPGPPSAASFVSPVLPGSSSALSPASSGSRVSPATPVVEAVPAAPVASGTPVVEAAPTAAPPSGGASSSAGPRAGAIPRPPSGPGSGSAGASQAVPAAAAAGAPPEGSEAGVAMDQAPAPGADGGRRAFAGGPGLLVLLAGWAVGAGALLARLGLGAARAGAVARRGEAVRERRVRWAAVEAASVLGLERPVALVWSREVPVPLTFGAVHPVLLLPRAAASWSDSRLRNVLLHELAHVQRRDWAWGVVAEVTRALHWLNPLAWLAVARLRRERELACDDRVLRIGCRPSDYASDLLDVAADLADGWRACPAAVPMARRHELGRRLRAILDPDVSRETVGRASLAAAAGMAALVALPVAALAPAEGAGPDSAALAAHPAPAPEFDPASAPSPELGSASAPASEVDPGSAPALAPGPVSAGATQERPRLCVFDSEERSTRVNSRDDRTTVEWTTGDCEVEIDIRGDIGFAADDSGITAVPDGARFEIEERDGLATRRLLAESGPGGSPAFRYWRNGEERPFEPEGRAWLAGILPELFRYTTIDAEARTRRILDRQGVGGVLAEIDRMESDHVVGTYLQHLMAMVELEPAVVRDVLDVARRRLDSDHYLSEVLVTLGRRDALSPAVHGAYLDAVVGLDSDHYAHEVLTVLLDRADLSMESRRTVLQAASERIDSDHYLSAILVRLVRRGELDRVGRAAFLEALRSVESDHYTHEVLGTFLDRGELAAGELAEVLALLDEVDSDHYRSELLRRVARERDLSGEALDAWGQALERVDSDHYVAQALSEVLARQPLEDGHVEAVLRLAPTIGSDHYLSELLLEVARRHPLAGALREEWLRTARRIDSDHYRGRVMAALGGGSD